MSVRSDVNMFDTRLPPSRGRSTIGVGRHRHAGHERLRRHAPVLRRATPAATRPPAPSTTSLTVTPNAWRTSLTSASDIVVVANDRWGVSAPLNGVRGVSRIGRGRRHVRLLAPAGDRPQAARRSAPPARAGGEGCAQQVAQRRRRCSRHADGRGSPRHGIAGGGGSTLVRRSSSSRWRAARPRPRRRPGSGGSWPGTRPARPRGPRAPRSPTAAGCGRAATTAISPITSSISRRTTGRRHADAADVVVEVEVRVLDPHRMVQRRRAPRRAGAGTAAAGAAGARSSSLNRSNVVPAGHCRHVEHRVLQRVHVERRRLVVEKARVQSRKSLHGCTPARVSRPWDHGGSTTKPSRRCVERVAREVDDGLLPSCQLAVAQGRRGRRAAHARRRHRRHPLRHLLVHEGARRVQPYGSCSPRARSSSRTASPTTSPSSARTARTSITVEQVLLHTSGLPARAARPAPVADPRRTPRGRSASGGSTGSPARSSSTTPRRPTGCWPSSSSGTTGATSATRSGDGCSSRSGSRASRSACPKARSATSPRSSHVGEPPTPDELEAVHRRAASSSVGRGHRGGGRELQRPRGARASACRAAARCRPPPTSRSSTRRCCTTRTACGTRSGCTRAPATSATRSTVRSSASPPTARSAWSWPATTAWPPAGAWATASGPGSFGHDGAGGQIAWADPDTGVSFVYLTNGHDRHLIRQWRRTRRHLQPGRRQWRAARHEAPQRDGRVVPLHGDAVGPRPRRRHARPRPVDAPERLLVREAASRSSSSGCTCSSRSAAASCGCRSTSSHPVWIEDPDFDLEAARPPRRGARRRARCTSLPRSSATSPATRSTAAARCGSCGSLEGLEDGKVGDRHEDAPRRRSTASPAPTSWRTCSTSRPTRPTAEPPDVPWQPDAVPSRLRV